MAGIDRATEDLLRHLTPQVLGALTRRHQVFDACEDAVQEALLAAATQWAVDGVPANPRGWLLAVAERRLTDEVRANTARRRREQTSHQQDSAEAARANDQGRASGQDDTLLLVVLCCHPALTESAQIALTLRSVGGLNTAQIAAAHLVPEATMGQRISRAKQRLRQAGATFSAPAPEELPHRLAIVLHVLYLVFNEGYTTSAGPDLLDVDLTTEATRLTRELHRLRPDDGEIRGLLALMLLTEARRGARTTPDGALVPLAEQDRTLWDRDLIDRGVELLSRALTTSRIGPYQLQAAIAAVHAEATSTEATDWAEILGLYALLEDLAPNPIVTLNRAIALAMVRGPDAGLRLLQTLADDPRMARHHRLPAVRAHLLEQAGEHHAARDAYLAAARRTTSVPERRYLEAKARTLAS